MEDSGKFDHAKNRRDHFYLYFSYSVFLCYKSEIYMLHISGSTTNGSHLAGELRLFFRDNVDVFISALTILRIKSETDFVSEKRNDFYITDALKIFSVFRLHGTIFSNFVING